MVYTAKKMPCRVALDFAYAGGRLIGGPYRDWIKVASAPLFRVNMAAEIKDVAEAVVPVRDFGTPEEGPFKQAMYRAAQHLMEGGTVYVGCGYGIGRTGTFLAALCKLNREVIFLLRRSRYAGDDALRNPVHEVRAVYIPQAVETDLQEAFLLDLDVRWVARKLAFKVRPLVVFDKRFWML